MSAAKPPLIRMLDYAFQALAWIAAALAALMMLTTFGDVVMRYLMRSPIPGSFEIIEASMGLIVFFALPWMIRKRGNIRVTILFDRLPPRSARAAACATDLLCAATCAFIAWRVWLFGERILRYGEVTMELRIPKGVVAQSMSVLLAVSAAAFLLCAIEALKGAQPDQESGAGI